MKQVALALITLLIASCAKTLTSEEQAWKQAEEVLKHIQEPVFPELRISVLEYGVVEGIEDYSNQGINQAILACSEQGGGTVVIPTGVFYTGPITMQSNVCLHLEDSAILRFSTHPSDYEPFVLSRWEGWDCINFKPLIYGYKLENVAITGNGILDGQASDENWWPWKSRPEYGWKPGMISQEWNGENVAGRNRLAQMEADEWPIEERIMTQEDRLRPPFIQFYSCKNVLISDVTIERAPFWLIHPLLSENIIVRGVTMESHGPNNDGCDPESCKNVLIEDCFFNTGDDCIAIKSGRNNDGRRWNIPSENIIVRNCTMKNGHGGVVIGSEITGGCRNVWAENCTMDSPELDRVLRIKSNAIRGGIIENVYMRNIEVGECKEAIFRVEMKYEKVMEGPHMPEIRNVYLTNVRSSKSRYGVWIDGFEEVISVWNVQVRDCAFNNVDKGNLIVGAEAVSFEQVYINGSMIE